MKGRSYMAEGNFLLDIVAALNNAKSQAQLNKDIRSLRKDLQKLELKAGIDKNSLDKIKNSLETIKIKAEIDPNAIQNMRSQINSLANQSITISNISINQGQAAKESQLAGQRIGEGLNKGLSSSLGYVKQSIADVIKDFTDKGKLNSFKLFQEFNLNRTGIDSSVTKQVQGLTRELNALAKEVLKTDSESAWDSIINKIGSLANVLKQYGMGRDKDQFGESIKLLEHFNENKIFVASKSDALSNTGMSIRELNNQFRNLGVTFTTVSKDAVKLDTVWSELFNISPGLQQFESYGDQLGALVKHFGIAKEAKYGEDTLRPLYANEEKNVLFDWMEKLEDASKKLTTLRSEQSEIEQQISSQSSNSTGTVVQNESRKQQAYQQTAEVQRASIQRASKELNAFNNFKINVVPQIKDGMSSGFYADQVQQQIEAYNRLGIELPNIKARIDELSAAERELNTVMGNGNSTIEQQKAAYDRFQASLKNAKASNSLAGSMYMSQDAVDGLVARLQTFLQKNTAMTANAKAEINGWISKLQQTDAVYKSMGNSAVASMKKISVEQRDMGRLGDSMLASLKKGFSMLSYWTSSTFVMMQAITKVRQAFSELKEVDTIMTEISKVSNLTKNELAELGDSALESASKYGRSVSDYLTGIQDFSRAGFRGQDAEDMAELSVLAQAAGDIDAELANKYLIATDAAYKLNGEAGKLNEILDGQNYIANNNATSMENLADATRVAASQAASSGVAVEEMSAAIGTMVSVTQDSGDVAGRAFKAILMNLQQVTGELDDGEVVDEESLTKYEQACNNLGVSLKEVRDGVVSLRDPMTVLRELSEAYTSLDKMDAKRASLISAVGGKHRGNQLNALLENFGMYDKMLADYSNGAGSAMNEAMKSANNWEGSLNRLHNTWVGTVENIANSNAIITVINGFNGILGVANKLTAALGSLSSIGLGAGLFAGLKNNGFFRAVQDSVDKTRTKLLLFNKDWGTYKTNWQSVSGIKNKIGSLFATTALSSSDTEAIRAYNEQIEKSVTSQTAFNRTMLNASPAAQNLVASCNGAKVSEEKLAVATERVTLAMKARTIAMRAASIAGNMVMFAAIAKGIQLAASAIENYVNRVEIANDAMDDAVSEYESAKSSLESLTSELDENQKKMDGLLAKEKLTYAEEGQLEELKEITQELLLQKEIEEHKAGRASKEAANKTVDAYEKQYGEYDASKATLEKNLGNSRKTGQFYMPRGDDDIVGNIVAYTRAKEVLADAQKDLENAVNNGEDTEFLEDDIQGYIDLIDSYSTQLEDNIADLQEKRVALQDEYNKAVEKRDSGAEPLTTSEKEIIGAYEAISDATKLVYEYTNQSGWNEMELSGIFSTQGIEKTKDDLIEMAKAAELTPEMLASYPKLNQAIQDSEIFLKNGETAAQAFCNEINACVDAAGGLESTILPEPPSLPFDEAWASLDSIEDSDSPMKDLKESLLELAEAGQLTIETFNETEGSGDFLKQLGLDPDKTVEIEDFLYKINELKSSADQLSSMRKGITSLSENLYSKKEEPEEAITADVFSGMDDALKAQTEEWENYVSVLGNASSSIDDVQRATDSLATAYINSNNFLANLTDSNKDYYISQLASMGVDNAEEIVQQSLTQKYQAHELQMRALAIVKDGVNAKTLNAVKSMLQEAGAAGEVKNAVLECVMAEQMFAIQDLGVDAKISQLGALISTLYGTAAAAEYAKAVLNQDAGNPYEEVSPEQAAKNIQNKYKEPVEIKMPTINTGGYSGGSRNSGSGGGSGSGSSSKPTPETFDFIEIAISRIEAAIERMKAKAEATFLSLKSRAKSYDKAIAKVTEEINLQTQAYSAYMAKANSFGLEAGYAAQVRDGSINIEDISDDGLKERIKNYQEWYEKALDCQDAIRELKNTQRELLQEKIEAYVTKYDQIISRLESASTRIQNSMDMKEAWGSQASAKDYKKLNRNMLSQVHNTILQRKKLLELRATVKKNTEAWREYNERVGESNTSIQELTKSIAENAIAQAALAKAKADRKNEGEDTADGRLDTRLSTASSASVKNRLINAKAKNIDQRQNNLKAAYASSKSSRAKLGSKIQKASQKNVSKKNKGLFQKAIKCVKSKKLIGTSTINAIANAMKSAKGKEYTALNSLLSYCNSYNAYKNAEDENKLAYEMYALTAQAEKKSLREEQLQNKLDNRQAIADRAATSIAETASAKNRNANIQASLAEGNAKIYASMRKLAASDRKKAAKKANFYSGKEYKKATGKLKTRLKKAASAIKSGKKITSDGLKAIKEYCTKYLNGNLTYYYNCMAYNEAVENEISAKDAETIANVEAYATRLQTKIDNAGNTVSSRDTQNELYEATAKNQKTAGAKNRYVDLRASNISKNLATYKSLYGSMDSSFNSMKNKVNGAKGADKNANAIISEVKKYTAKDSLIPQSLITKAYTVSDSFGRACEKYNESLEARNVAKETYGLYKETSKTELASLAAEKMENIDREYGNKMAVHTQKATQLNNAIDLAQAKGYQASKAYYGKLYDNEEDRNALLTQKRAELVKSLSESVQNGSIEKYTDEWYDLVGQIDDVTNALDESTLSLEEYKNQMRQIEWDNFEYLEGRISDTISEMDFMINELSRQGLTSDKTGSLTDAGRSVAMLHAMNYNVYGQQAEDYAEQARKIDRELAKDPYNKTLIDQKREYIKAMQDATKSAEDEKYAIIDLYKQGYEALIAKVRDLISEYSGLLDAEKDAFDYNNNITDKAKEIASLRKQLEAYAGDVSEETRAKVQTLKVSLEDAEKDLQETQYDKYISDTKDMLSDLGDDFEDAIQELIDNLHLEFDKLIKDINSNAATSTSTIIGKMSGIGYLGTEEFKALLSEINKAGDGTGDKVGAAANGIVDGIKDSQKEMQDAADKNAGATNTGTAASEIPDREDGKHGSSKPTPTFVPLPAGTGSLMTSEEALKALHKDDGGTEKEEPKLTDPKQAGDTFVMVEDRQANITKAELDAKAKKAEQKAYALDYIKRHVSATKKEYSTFTDLNKKVYSNFGGKVLSTKEMKGLAAGLGVKYDNAKSTGALYKKLKSLGVKGFRAGSRHIPYSQLAFLGEGVNELQFDKSQGVLKEVGQGDKVFTGKMAENLWKVASADPSVLLGGRSLKQDIVPVRTGNGVGDVNINMGGITMNDVNDPKAFTHNLLNAIANDRNVKGLLVNETVGRLSSNFNSLSGRKFLK